jgi:glucans biosynthesis protein C
MPGGHSEVKTPMSLAQRIHFIDNLRAAVILLVVVLHGSMTYMAYAPAWWYVINPQTSLFFTALVLAIDVPIMPVMFFISGYFVLPGLQRRGAAAFLKDKAWRIGLPWLLGVLLLAPPTAYLSYYSRHVPMGLLEFWQTDFWTKAYQQSVYWYLGILLTLFLALALVYQWRPGLPARLARGAWPAWPLLAGFAALMAAGFLVLNLFFDLDAWQNAGYVLVFQPLRLPLYAGYFALGVYAQRQGWFTAEGYRPGLANWGAGSLLLGAVYVGWRLSPVSSSPDLWSKALTALLFNAFCLTTLMGALALFQAKVNGAGRVWRSLSANSYGIYYFHPLLLYPLAYVFVAVPLPLALKAFSVISLGTLLTWLFSRQIVRKLPLLRDIF